jgi:hypothetical protein
MIVFGSLALVSSACTVEVVERDGDSIVDENDARPGAQAGERRGGPQCAPVFGVDREGNPYVSELICPLPARPEHDPETGEGEGLGRERIAGGRAGVAQVPR